MDLRSCNAFDGTLYNDKKIKPLFKVNRQCLKTRRELMSLLGKGKKGTLDKNLIEDIEILLSELFPEYQLPEEIDSGNAWIQKKHTIATESNVRYSLDDSNDESYIRFSLGSRTNTVCCDYDESLYELEKSFYELLLAHINVKGKKDADIYNKANIDRRHFAKIRNAEYKPSKKTVLALAIALELSLEETRELLECAGFALSRSLKFDVIIEYFISHKRYDLIEINDVLAHFDQRLLGT